MYYRDELGQSGVEDLEEQDNNQAILDLRYCSVGLRHIALKDTSAPESFSHGSGPWLQEERSAQGYPVIPVPHSPGLVATKNPQKPKPQVPNPKPYIAESEGGLRKVIERRVDLRATLEANFFGFR